MYKSVHKVLHYFITSHRTDYSFFAVLLVSYMQSDRVVIEQKLFCFLSFCIFFIYAKLYHSNI